MATIVPFRIARPAAKLRLFCFPFAGAAANVYRTWPRLFGDEVDVCPVELPGRGLRAREPLAADMVELRTRVTEDLAPLLEDEVPVALFGHSMGAKLAFELSKGLGRRVVHLFVSAASAPDVRAPHPMAELPRAEFISELRRIGGTPEEVLADDEVMDLFLPVLRADLRLHEHYVATDGVRAPCGVTTFAATADARVSVDMARGWEVFSSGPFRLLTLDAGHHFLGASAAMLAREIVSDLQKVVRFGH